MLESWRVEKTVGIAVEKHILKSLKFFFKSNMFLNYFNVPILKIIFKK